MAAFSFVVCAATPQPARAPARTGPGRAPARPGLFAGGTSFLSARLLGAVAAPALLLGAACAPGHARTPSGESASATVAQVGELPTISVSGSRAARPIEDVPATVSVREAPELEAEQVKDIRGLERYEPNVSVRRAPSRFSAAGASVGRPGNEGFNIRGLEGNRVLILMDGVRLPNAFSFGAGAFGRGDHADIETVQRVEILRGPASTLYGSDGLAGVVSFVTRDPADLLRGRTAPYLTAGLGYSQEDRTWTKTLGAATRAGKWDAMVFYTRRDGHELASRGTNDAPNLTRTKPNPQDYGSDSILAKVLYHFSPDNRIRLTVDDFRRDGTTNALSAVAVPPLAATSVLALNADDSTRRTSLIVDQRIGRLGWAMADTLRWNLYNQSSRSRQLGYEDRNTAADRIRDNGYDEKWTGGGVVLEKAIESGNIQHLLVYGFDASQATYKGLRDGTVPPAGETFPTKAFPDTDYRLFGLFGQDEIRMGALSLIAGLRYDAYQYRPKADPLYTGQSADASDSQLSPRLGAIWRFAPEHSVFANLSDGFRAPTADQINNGFANTVANYRSVANPDLKPETSRSLEVGVRRAGRDVQYTASVFSGKYRDFIDQRQVSGNFTIATPAIFQYVNVGRVRLSGFEASGSARVAPAWRVLGGIGVTKGENESTNQPLNSVDPFKVFAGLNWEPGAGRLLALRLTHVGAKKAERIDSAALVTAPATQFATPAYTTVDLFGSWQVTKSVRLTAGLFNLTDRKYWRWTDMRGLASNSTVIDAYSQPGRNLALQARIEL